MQFIYLCLDFLDTFSVRDEKSHPIYSPFFFLFITAVTYWPGSHFRASIEWVKFYEIWRIINADIFNKKLSDGKCLCSWASYFCWFTVALVGRLYHRSILSGIQNQDFVFLRFFKYKNCYYGKVLFWFADISSSWNHRLFWNM